MGSSLMSTRSNGKAWVAYVTLIALVLTGGILVTRCQPEIGMSEPGTGSLKTTAAVADVANALEADVSYDEYSAVLRVAVVTHRTMAVHDTSDGRVEKILMRALECYEVIRAASQAQVEDAWDPATHGVAEYWTALHPGLELDIDGEIDYEGLVEACSEKADTHLEEALDLVGS